jgi:DNA-binding NarL/FixJ family response regulator
MYAILADDELMLRELLSASLTHAFKFDMLTTNNAGDAVELTRKYNPVLVIMDMMMSGMGTFDAIAEIRRMAPYTKVMILSGRADVDLLIRSRAVKAHGYCLKGDLPDEIHYAVKTVMRGGIYMPPSLSTHLLDPAREGRSAIDALTPKERSALGLLAQGKTMKEVAFVMRISVKTAETHRNNLGRKLNHPTKAQLISFAIQHKLISHSDLAISA